MIRREQGKKSFGLVEETDPAGRVVLASGQLADAGTATARSGETGDRREVMSTDQMGVVKVELARNPTVRIWMEKRKGKRKRS